MDKFEKLFEMQTALNDNIFQKKAIKAADGSPLTMAKLLEEGKASEEKNALSNTNVWLSNYLRALNDESRELGEELLWKWWSKDPLDMQNIRVEIVDQLHFWISLALTAGMDANKVFDIYSQKNALNFARQERGYSKATKDENDNKGIG